MLQIVPHMRILVAREPLDLRRGIDGTAEVCRLALREDPQDGTVFVFRSRSGKMIRILVYDGQGFWLMTKRLSQGRFAWWPPSVDPCVPLSARELIILTWNGDPERAQMAQDWRRVA